ncbi:MAG: TonB-dependent receptor [Candidatus Aminicenantes bacterium]|jgi:iron complex outermembrane receptor protein
MIKKYGLGKIFFSLLLGGVLLLRANLQAFQDQEQEEKEKQKVITEEIVVESRLPRELPISTTYSIKKEQIEVWAPRDLSEVLSFASGTFVSAGSKNEFRLKIRGFEGQRIVLLYDGIPIYEPYFNSFDLKTLPAEIVENVKVVKGASSVLYGPNALGGVVNIITKRPQPPSFSLRGMYDSNGGYSFAASGSVRWEGIIFLGSVDYNGSEGFRWKQNSENVRMDNSDYERRNVLGKIYFYPWQKQEILLELAHYSSEFGIPAAQEHYFPRYWRFKKWNRTQVNLGGTFTLFRKSSLKLRTYFVRHDNVLDAFADSGLTAMKWESTYANSSLGVFLIGTVPYITNNEVKFSLNFRDDNVRIQDDVGAEWKEFAHQTVSLGAENHFQFALRWKLVGGVSLDYLKKYTGENKASLNPIVGIKFNPADFVDFHLTLSQKSRFPPMKSMYSLPYGNPDLRDERATSYEFGVSYEKGFHFNGAVFYNRIKDLIQIIRLPDGYNTNSNVGRARLFGFELGLQKALDWAEFSLNYTFLDGRNLEENRPLDLLPESQFNFAVNSVLPLDVKCSLWGLAVSRAEVRIKDVVVSNPSYFVLNAMVSKRFTGFTIFFKGENLLNRFYTTEPGYPMKSRTLAFGFRVNFSKE